MTSRHAGLLCKVGKCKCSNVDKALNVCRTETLRYNVGVSMYLWQKQMAPGILTCNLMEVHHRDMMVRILREPRMRMLRLWCELMCLAHLARCLVHQGICILLLRRHHVVIIAILGGVFLILIFRLLVIDAIHALAALLVALHITIGLVVSWLAVAIVRLLLVVFASSILILSRLTLGGILAILILPRLTLGGILAILVLAISCVASLLSLWAIASTGCLSSSAIHS